MYQIEGDSYRLVTSTTTAGATTALILLPAQERAELGVTPASGRLLVGWKPIQFGRRCSPAKVCGVVDQSQGRASNHRPGVIGAMKERPGPEGNRESDWPAGQLRRHRRRMALRRLEHRPPQSGHVVEKCRPGDAAVVDVAH